MKRIGIGLIKVYRVVFAWLPSSCRYEPTCSRYTEQAIERYGLLKGSLMGARADRPLPSLASGRLRPGALNPMSPALRLTLRRLRPWLGLALLVAVALVFVAACVAGGTPAPSLAPGQTAAPTPTPTLAPAAIPLAPGGPRQSRCR